MKSILTLLIFIISTAASANNNSKIASHRKSIANHNAKIAQLLKKVKKQKVPLNQLHEEDIELQEFNSEVTNQRLLLHDMFIVEQQNQDSLEALVYFIEDHYRWLDLASNQIRPEEVNTEKLNAKEQIYQMVLYALGTYEEFPDKPTRQDIINLVNTTMEEQQKISKGIVDAQYHLSFEIIAQTQVVGKIERKVQSHRNSIADLEVKIEALKKAYVPRPQDEPSWWHSQGLLMP